ncbi:MAG: hypothetical protein LBD78_01820 [Spirochaetaceae bacterium]|jgi:hypothetical protein|nr:hypothetical protein [Spirochaetaceae bacterium]
MLPWLLSYVTGAANVIDKESYSGPKGYFTPIRQLTDLDGSIWWWPYPFDAKDHGNMKRAPGKCGWASGALLGLIIHDWFGISHNGERYILWNCASFSIDVSVRLFGNSLIRNGKTTDFTGGVYLNRKTVKASFSLLPGEKAVFEAR